MISKSQYGYLKAHTDLYPYVASDKWVCQLDYDEKEDEYKLITISTGMKVEEKMVDTDNGLVRLKLKYYTGIDEAYQVFDSSVLSKFGIKELLNYGIRFTEKYCENVIEYLIRSENSALIQQSYKKLGWSERNGSILFKSGMSIGNNSNKDLSYFGILDLTPHGSLEKWIELVKDEILCRTPITVILLLGFASPLLSYLNKKNDLGSILFNLSNSSSKGKTTSAMLAASVFSNPLMNKGTMISYNATENALIEFISNCQGHTVIIDEVALSNSRDFTKLMYTVCNGRSKMRLNGDSTQKEVKEFSSIVISTAEFNLIDNDSPNGVRTRVFEINDIFTSSAENSDRIKSVVIQNYAVAGERYMPYLYGKIGQIDEDYSKVKSHLVNLCQEKKELSERILSKLAIILQTAEYVKECFDLEIDVTSIEKYLLDLERNISAETSPDDRLLEVITEETLKNISKFADGCILPSAQCIGVILEHDDETTELRIIESAFKRMMQERQITNYKPILKSLKKRGILSAESDRLYKRVVISDDLGRVNCYCFLLKKERCVSALQNQKPNTLQGDDIEELDIDSLTIEI